MEQTTDLQLTATLPQEMIQSQAQLIQWVDKKAQELFLDSCELKESIAIAEQNEWPVANTLKRHYSKTIKRVQYYHKILSALKEGYYIVPNFPVHLFAIRTDKKKPAAMLKWETGWDALVQSPPLLEEGKGEYRNPRPVVYSRMIKMADNTEKKQVWAEAWRDVDFPINMAKPVIMEVTSKAMAKKVFDQIGVFPDPWKTNDDPVIIGQIVSKTNAYSIKTVSFMIAWHLNTRDL